jgi:prepilin-type N-terminal cleavage/methylation domain-containing protein
MLKKLQKNNSEGFTIIEVMIVLAIAGLILLIVFLAVPALQRNGRNTQRKADVQSVLGAISDYSANNNGAAPTSLAQATQGTKTGFYANPGDMDFGVNNTPIGTVDNSKLYVRIAARCNPAGDNIGGVGASSRNVAVVYTLETTGALSIRCQES